MSKAKKLAEKRRRAAEKAGLPELAPVQKRQPQHRHKGRFARREEDPSKPAIAVRCRIMGKDATEVNMRDARAPWNGCNAGRAMADLVAGDRDRGALWDAIQHMRRVWIAYGRAMGAPNRYAQSLRLLAPTDAMQADATTPPADLRSEEDRYRQAVSAREAVRGWLAHTDAYAAAICIATVLDDSRCIDGDAMVRALRCVADGMAGRKVLRMA